MLASSGDLSSPMPGAGKKAEDNPTSRTEAKIARKEERTEREGVGEKGTYLSSNFCTSVVHIGQHYVTVIQSAQAAQARRAVSLCGMSLTMRKRAISWRAVVRRENKAAVEPFMKGLPLVGTPLLSGPLIQNSVSG